MNQTIAIGGDWALYAKSVMMAALLAVVFPVSLGGCPLAETHHENFPSAIRGTWTGHDGYLYSESAYTIGATFHSSYCDVVVEDIAKKSRYSARLWCTDVQTMELDESVYYGWYWQTEDGYLSVSGGLEVDNNDENWGRLAVPIAEFVGASLPYIYYVEKTTKEGSFW